MEMEFDIDILKLKENNAIGVDVMFSDGNISFIYGDEVEIINTFLMDLSLHDDIETYLIYRSDALYLGKFIKDKYDIIRDTISNIIEEKGYDLDAEAILNNTLENINKNIKRHGLNLTFETLIV